MLLGQIRLENGDVPGAVTALQDLASKVGRDPGAASVHGLLAAALSQSNKAAEAAAEYEKAAGLTVMPNEKAMMLAKAGHSYTQAGKTADAKRVWELVAAQQDNQALAGEARVRLGEIAAAGKV